MFCSIYKIKNQVNGKVYVGQTWKTIQERFAEHKVPSNKGCIHLHRALNKYGRTNFTVELITVCGTQTSADYWEAHFIKQYDTIQNGYNIKTGGHLSKMTDATKQKLSQILKGRLPWNKGRTNIYSEDTLKKMSVWQVGRTFTTEQKAKVSQSLIGNKRNLGRKTYEETKAKISASLTGRKRSPLSVDLKAKLSAIHRGRKLPDDQREKMSAAHKGKTWKLVDGKRVYSTPSAITEQPSDVS